VKSIKSRKALITCEVTPEFLSAIKERGIEYSLAGWGQTGQELEANSIVEIAKDCELIIAEIENMSESVLKELPNLRFLGVSRGSPVNVDLNYCAANQITVVNTPGRNGDSVADYCLAMILNLSRNLVRSKGHLNQHGWMFDGKLPYLEFRGRELRNLTVGLYGFGQIGVRVAKRLKDGFGSKVLYFDPFVKNSTHAKPVYSLEELFEASDVISLHAPVVDSTKNSVNRALLQKLGREGLIISSARAGLIVEEDLYQAVTKGEIAGAALDVYWNEPLEKSSRWLALDNVICTPHIAGASSDVVANHCDMILRGIDEWLRKVNQQKELA
jgi:phosphoglycerate dehydrogenase-like enzyme